MRRASMAAAICAGVLAVGLGGWGVAQSARPAEASASAGRVLQLRYEVRAETPYAPPPATEETRLQVLAPASAVLVDDGVLSAQAGEALRSLQAEDAARTAAALAAVRKETLRFDREASAEPSQVETDDVDTDDVDAGEPRRPVVNPV